jgi:hypothetical protein
MIISEERKRERAELEEAIGLLRAELTIERQARKGEVIDLPAGSWWRRSDAA